MTFETLNLSSCLLLTTQCTVLGTLNTDPKHSRRGAGALLLQWGIEEGRKRGLPVYLHSSLQGHALYLKHGFRDLEELVADFSKWGLEERNYNWAMVKEP